MEKGNVDRLGKEPNSRTAATKYVGVENRNGVNLHKVTISYSDINFEQNAPALELLQLLARKWSLSMGAAPISLTPKNNRWSIPTSSYTKGKITLSVQGMEIPLKSKFHFTFRQID